MQKKCGYIALIGRPNVGKSTLLNKLIGQKISITSRKPQTTRHKILGILTQDEAQFIFVDTPGMHKKHASSAINKVMNKAALQTIREVDVIIFLVEGLNWKEEDTWILERLAKEKVPCILAINKIDKISDKDELLPYIEEKKSLMPFAAIVPMSAKSDIKVDVLLDTIKTLLPYNNYYYDEEQITDRPVKFLCAEILREKIFRLCGQELPYATSVEIEAFKEEEKYILIHALIWVDKESHKRMIIGDGGAKLKDIATAARLDMQVLLEHKVVLKCWCKVKSGWADDARFLKQAGYE